jgi:hypothetical protein
MNFKAEAEGVKPDDVTKELLQGFHPGNSNNI